MFAVFFSLEVYAIFVFLLWWMLLQETSWPEEEFDQRWAWHRWQERQWWQDRDSEEDRRWWQERDEEEERRWWQEREDEEDRSWGEEEQEEEAQSPQENWEPEEFPEATLEEEQVVQAQHEEIESFTKFLEQINEAAATGAP